MNDTMNATDSGGALRLPTSPDRPPAAAAAQPRRPGRRRRRRWPRAHLQHRPGDLPGRAGRPRGHRWQRAAVAPACSCGCWSRRTASTAPRSPITECGAGLVEQPGHPARARRRRHPEHRRRPRAQTLVLLAVLGGRAGPHRWPVPRSYHPHGCRTRPAHALRRFAGTVTWRVRRPPPSRPSRMRHPRTPHQPPSTPRTGGRRRPPRPSGDDRSPSRRQTAAERAAPARSVCSPWGSRRSPQACSSRCAWVNDTGAPTTTAIFAATTLVVGLELLMGHPRRARAVATSPAGVLLLMATPTCGSWRASTGSTASTAPAGPERRSPDQRGGATPPTSGGPARWSST